MRDDSETEKTGVAKNDNGPLEIFIFLSLIFFAWNQNLYFSVKPQLSEAGHCNW